MAKVLVVGQGGREHAIAWKLSQSETVKEIFIAPGNAGTQTLEKAQNVNIKDDELDKLLQFAKDKDIDLAVIGPEIPLTLGITNLLNDNDIPCFGPSKEASKLEASKSWCKQLLSESKIPTAEYAEFTSFESAKNYLQHCNYPTVIKADGLAAGKGVVIAKNKNQALSVANDMLNGNAFGKAGNKIIVEEFLSGTEASFIVMANGTKYIPLASSQDHKPRDDGNKGPNTGGMGAFSPSPAVTHEIQDIIETQIIKTTLHALQDKGINYKGFLYAGIMLTDQGPKVLEFNCRMGDPETQAILMRMDSDLYQAIINILDDNSENINLQWSADAAVTVVMASKDYPFSYPKGEKISGLENIATNNEILVFHAGTQKQGDSIITNGGRVLNVTATGTDVKSASNKVYSNIASITWPTAFYRKDIGN